MKFNLPNHGYLVVDTWHQLEALQDEFKRIGFDRFAKKYKAKFQKP